MIRKVKYDLKVRGGFPVVASAVIDFFRHDYEILEFEVSTVKGGSIDFLRLSDEEVVRLVEDFRDRI